MSEDTEQSFVSMLAQQGGVILIDNLGDRVFSFLFLVVDRKYILAAARRQRCLADRPYKTLTFYG